MVSRRRVYGYTAQSLLVKIILPILRASRMVQSGGFEPPTSCSTNRRSNQLSYNCILHKALKGTRMGSTLDTMTLRASKFLGTSMKRDFRN